MKNFRFIFLSWPLPVFMFLMSFTCKGQSGIWTWMKGDSTSNTATYGVMGIPSINNNPPGRYNPGVWTDTAGNFWIYGGGSSSRKNDLWIFNPDSLTWTWMNGGQGTGAAKAITGAKGVYTAQNQPGALGWGFNTWITPDNHFWLFGGEALGTNNDDLWQYDPGINEWAWMGNFGPANYGVKGTGDSTTMPGGRNEGNSCWTDSAGNLWLFGGNGYKNDLWKYNVHTGLWTWMSGSSTTTFDAGVYITKGIPSVNEYPSSRDNDMFWKDENGFFWLVGGQYAAANKFWQDIWKFNPNTLEWTWVNGPSASDTTHPTENECDTDYINNFGARWENRSAWKYCDDMILTYGGFWNWPNHYTVNDMWAYIPSKNSWIKVTHTNAGGHFGTQGVPSAQNNPPTRFGAVTFTDKHKNLWLFSGYQSSNDFWRYQLDTLCPAVQLCKNIAPANQLQVNTLAVSQICSGTCSGTAKANAFNGTPPYSYLWQPGNYTTDSLNHLCAGTYTVTVTDHIGTTVSSSVVINPGTRDSVSATTAQNRICTGDSSLICADSGFVSYYWSNGVTSRCIDVTAPGNYKVTATDVNGCTAVSAPVQIVELTGSPPGIISQHGDTLFTSQTTDVQWYYNGTAIQGAHYSWYIANRTGSYTVSSTDKNCGTVFSAPYQFVFTDVTDPAADNVKVFPNPSAGSWFLEVSDKLIGSKLDIFDDAGRLVYNAQITNRISELSVLSSGVYMLRIYSNTGIRVKKLVKI